MSLCPGPQKLLRRLLTAYSTLLLSATSSATGAPGDVDPLFHVEVNGIVRTTALQPDGKILIGGEFTVVNSQPRTGLARLHPDGSLDTSFDVHLAPHQPSGFHSVNSIAVQSDSKIVFAGAFSMAGGVERSAIARVLSNGTPDLNFNPSVGSTRLEWVEFLVPQPDEKFIVTGAYLLGATVARRTICRIDADGTLDGTYKNSTVDISADAWTGSCFVVQPDGKILVSDASNPQWPSKLAVGRLHADGSLETALWTQGINPHQKIIALQPDGKVLVSSDDDPKRLAPDGTMDSAFAASTEQRVNFIYTRSLTLQCDGKILLGGSSFSNRNLTRLNADGSLDESFMADAPHFLLFDSGVHSIHSQPDGKIIVAGLFESVNNVPQPFLVRLQGDVAPESLTLPAPGKLRWLRGGGAPETHLVTFEQSLDGGHLWTRLGNASRIPGGWELNAAFEPAGHIRARARVISGKSNGSASLVETVLALQPTPIEAWRQQHFGTAADAGRAANLIDADGDGMPNLIEFAFAQDPLHPGSMSLPEPSLTDGNFTLGFTAPAGTDGIIYGAEWCTDPAGPWTPVADTGTRSQHVFSIPTAGKERLMLRLTVRPG